MNVRQLGFKAKQTILADARSQEEQFKKQLANTPTGQVTIGGELRRSLLATRIKNRQTIIKIFSNANN